MAESTQSYVFANFQSDIGQVMGFGSDSATWSSAQITEIAKCLKDGLNHFYMMHDWQFLKVLATISAISGTSAYDLPDNFGGYLIAPFTYASGAAWVYEGVQLVEESEIRRMQQLGTIKSPMMYAAVRIKSAATPVDPTTAGQRWQVIFWPTPGASYTMTYKYQIQPNALTTGNYPYGNTAHMACMKEFCLANAELRMNGEMGTHYQMAMQMLEKAIEIDNRSRPVFQGVVRDGRGLPGQLSNQLNSYATYGGVQY